MLVTDLPTSILDAIGPVPVKVMGLAPHTLSRVGLSNRERASQLIEHLRDPKWVARRFPPIGTKGRQDLDLGLSAFAESLAREKPEHLKMPFGLSPEQTAILDGVRIDALGLPLRIQGKLVRNGCKSAGTLLRACARAEWVVRLIGVASEREEVVRALDAFASRAGSLPIEALTTLGPRFLPEDVLTGLDRVPLLALDLPEPLRAVILERHRGMSVGGLLRRALELHGWQKPLLFPYVRSLETALWAEIEAGTLRPALKTWAEALERRAGWPLPELQPRSGPGLVETLTQWARAIPGPPIPLVDVTDDADRVNLPELLLPLAERVVRLSRSECDFDLLVRARGLYGGEALIEDEIAELMRVPVAFLEQKIAGLIGLLRGALQGHVVDPRFRVPGSLVREASWFEGVVNERALHPPSAIEAGLAARYGRELSVQARSALPLLMELSGAVLVDVTVLRSRLWSHLWCSWQEEDVRGMIAEIRRNLATQGWVSAADLDRAFDPWQQRGSSLAVELLDLMEDVEWTRRDLYGLRGQDRTPADLSLRGVTRWRLARRARGWAR